jgi:hypothetical protein
MRHDHIPFDTMCALAAGDHLTHEQHADLRAHCAICDACSQRLLEMKKIGAELFLVHALQESDQRLPKGMHDRFLMRANREGIPLKPRAEKLNPFYMSLLSAVALLVITITVVSSWHNFHSTRTFLSNSTQVSGPKDIVDREVSLSQAKPALLQTHGTLSATIDRQQLKTRRSHDESGDAFARTPSPQPHENTAATRTPRVTLVMYTPQPRIPNDSIPTTTLPISELPLTRTYRNLYPALSPVSGKKIVETWIQRDANVFAHTFLLNEEKSLLGSLSEVRQSPVQDASIPNGTFNFKLIQSDFRIP